MLGQFSDWKSKPWRRSNSSKLATISRLLLSPKAGLFFFPEGWRVMVMRAAIAHYFGRFFGAIARQMIPVLVAACMKYAGIAYSAHTSAE
jgi:hypothetical protein